MDAHLWTELAGIALSTFVGAWAAFRLQAKREEAQGRARRAAVATAIIADLRALEPVLIQLYRHEQAGSWQGKRFALFFNDLRSETTALTAAVVSSNSVKSARLCTMAWRRSSVDAWPRAWSWAMSRAAREFITTFGWSTEMSSTR